MREISLTQNKTALVDDSDFEYLNQWKWHVYKSRRTFYAARQTRLDSGKQRKLGMHQVIMGKSPNGFVTDHKDGNGLNNQRDNLRIVTHRQNAQNQHHRYKTSQYPGVSRDKLQNRWQVRVLINGKKKHLGYSKDEAMAFELYKKAVENLGENILLQ